MKIPGTFEENILIYRVYCRKCRNFLSFILYIMLDEQLCYLIFNEL